MKTLALCLLLQSAVGAGEVGAILDRAIARETAIHSGEFTYTLHSKASTLDSPTVGQRILFEGDEKWRVDLRWPAGHDNGNRGISAQLHGERVEYSVFTKQSRSLAEIRMPQTLTERYRRLGNRPPLYAGSFPNPVLSKWWSAKRDRVRLVGTETVNGEVTKILEIKTEPGERDAATSVTPNPFLRGDNTYRLYVAPAGHIVRLDGIHDGVILYRYTCHRFQQVSPGIWAPEEFWIWYDHDVDVSEGGGKDTSEKHAWDIGWDRVNQEIPDKDFQFVIEESTQVTDHRIEGLYWFRVWEGNVVSTKLSAMSLEYAGRDAVSPFWRRWRRR